MNHFQEDYFKSFDQANIFYRTALPSKSIKSVVILIHGWGEHSSHHGEIIENILEAGFGVYAIDLRGYGHSQGQRGYISSWADYLQDVYFLAKIIVRLYDKAKIFVVAHSMGGAVAIRFLQTYQQEIPVSGLVLSAPMLKVVVQVPEIKLKLARFMSKWIPHFSLSNPIPGDQLTHDPEKIAQIEQDPLFHFKANSRWYTEAMRAMELSLAEASKIDVPTLILHGTEDQVNALEGSELFFDQLTVRDKEFCTLEGMRHALFDELNRKKVFAKVVGWIKKHS